MEVTRSFMKPISSRAVPDLRVFLRPLRDRGCAQRTWKPTGPGRCQLVPFLLLRNVAWIRGGRWKMCCARHAALQKRSRGAPVRADPISSRALAAVMGLDQSDEGPSLSEWIRNHGDPPRHSSAIHSNSLLFLNRLLPRLRPFRT